MFNNFITSYLIPKVTSIVGLHRMYSPSDNTILMYYIIDIVVNDLVTHYDPTAVKLFLDADGDDDFFRLYRRSIGSKVFKALVGEFQPGVGYTISENFTHLFSEMCDDDDVERPTYLILK